jgi:hypothetical protein
LGLLGDVLAGPGRMGPAGSVQLRVRYGLESFTSHLNLKIPVLRAAAATVRSVVECGTVLAGRAVSDLKIRDVRAACTSQS